MKKLSKRLKELKSKIELRPYSPQEAIDLLKEVGTAKFIESVEAHICLNVNPKYADQQVRATVVLPHGTGKEIRIAALVANSVAFLIKKKFPVICTYSCIRCTYKTPIFSTFTIRSCHQT